MFAEMNKFNENPIEDEGPERSLDEIIGGTSSVQEKEVADAEALKAERKITEKVHELLMPNMAVHLRDINGKWIEGIFKGVDAATGKGLVIIEAERTEGADTGKFTEASFPVEAIQEQQYEYRQLEINKLKETRAAANEIAELLAGRQKKAEDGERPYPNVDV